MGLTEQLVRLMQVGPASKKTQKRFRNTQGAVSGT